jgi:hypothetical protein
MSLLPCAADHRAPATSIEHTPQSELRHSYQTSGQRLMEVLGSASELLSHGHAKVSLEVFKVVQTKRHVVVSYHFFPPVLDAFSLTSDLRQSASKYYWWYAASLHPYQQDLDSQSCHNRQRHTMHCRNAAVSSHAFLYTPLQC